jgi:anti-anti-sigma factor
VAPITVTTDHADPPVAIVELTGEHDGFTTHRIEQELARLHDAGMPIVVDLLQASFVDSSTLSALLTAQRHAEEASLGFALAFDDATSLQVHRILSTTGLQSAFVVAPTREEAIAAVRQGVGVPTSEAALRPPTS